MLLPGASLDVEFAMMSGSNTKIAASAQCVVTGGPEYTLKVRGESSTVAFSLDRSVIDFGKVVYITKKEEELYITNSGKVIFDYAIHGSSSATVSHLSVSP